MILPNPILTADSETPDLEASVANRQSEIPASADAFVSSLMSVDESLASPEDRPSGTSTDQRATDPTTDYEPRTTDKTTRAWVAGAAHAACLRGESQRPPNEPTEPPAPNPQPPVAPGLADSTPSPAHLPLRNEAISPPAAASIIQEVPSGGPMEERRLALDQRCWRGIVREDACGPALGWDSANGVNILSGATYEAASAGSGPRGRIVHLQLGRERRRQTRLRSDGQAWVEAQHSVLDVQQQDDV